MKTFVTVTKALADKNRVRAYMALRNGELCVCQIIELLGLAPSTVSKHMSILKHAGLVESRKQERWIYYTFAKDVLKNTQQWVADAVGGDETILKDDADLKKIKNTNPDILCKKHRNAQV
jgi:ArsR family transcriptional regulator